MVTSEAQSAEEFEEELQFWLHPDRNSPRSLAKESAWRNFMINWGHGLTEDEVWNAREFLDASIAESPQEYEEALRCLEPSAEGVELQERPDVPGVEQF